MRGDQHHEDHDNHDGHGHHDGHDHGSTWWHRLRHLCTPHSHDTTDKIDTAMETSGAGMRALWISLLVLAATAAAQAAVVACSGSVALLGDTVHNGADALTALPLGAAFLLARRATTRRYTYGYGRAEDLAGIAIVATITASAVLACYQAVDRLLHPQPVTALPAVAAAGLVGFVGNELVARYRITVGRRIGSAALVADGLHARTDGFASLAVLVGAGGVAIGLRWADPVAGLLITLAILLVAKDAAGQVYHRLMDAVDPTLLDTAEATLRETPGVLETTTVRLRWIGHQLRAECEIGVAAQLTVEQAHAIAVDAEHRLIHALPRLSAAAVHTDPYPTDRPTGASDPHAALAHHR